MNLPFFQNTGLRNGGISVSQRYLIGILLVLLLAHGIRLYRMTHDNLTIQEGESIAFASLPTQEFFQHAHDGDVYPNFYPVLLRGWYFSGNWLHGLVSSGTSSNKSAGQDKFVMQAPWSKVSWQWDVLPDIFWGRFLSLLCGLVSILLIYLIGRVLVNDWVGLMSAILLAFSPSHIRICREITPVSMQFCLLMATFFCYLKAENYSNRVKEDSDSTKTYLGFAVVGVVFFGLSSFLIHPSSSVLIILLFICTLFSKSRKQFILIGFLILWILIEVWEYYWQFPILSYMAEINVTPSSKWIDYMVSFGFLDIFIIKPAYVNFFSSIILIAILLSGIIFSRNKNKSNENHKPNILFFLYFLLLGSIVLFTICKDYMGVSDYSSWTIYLIPFLCLILAVGWQSYPVPNWKYRLLVLIIILDLGYIHSLYVSKPLVPAQELINRLNTWVTPIDRVVIVPQEEAYGIDYYYQKPSYRMFIKDINDLLKMKEETRSGVPRVWLVRLPSKSLSGKELAFIQQLNGISSKHFVHYVVWKPVFVTVTCYEMKENVKD